MMRSHVVVLIALISLLMTGCASRTMPALIERDADLTDHNTTMIIIRGSEADIGAGHDVVIEDYESIQKVWDAIYQSRPYDVWYSSGYRVLEMYDDPDAPPKIVLYVNESGATHTSLNAKRFRCPGLHDLIDERQQSLHSVPDDTATQIHTVKEGDTLAWISQHYYGSANQWLRIVDANKDTLTDPRDIRVGMKLRIPSLPSVN